ncbi:MAG: hypothetical protein Q8P73_04670 [bacterium]|nr:hypothetical protein [bacterium]
MRRFILVVLTLAACAVAVGAEDNSETLLYLGCGERIKHPVIGYGKLYTTDWKGNVLREVKLEGVPAAIGVSGREVLVAIPNTSKVASLPKTGQLVGINEEGEVYTFSFDRNFVADPCSMAIRENPFEVFMADGTTDYVAGMTADGKTRKYFANRGGDGTVYQHISIAITNELLLVATEYPRPGVYAVKLGDGTASRERKRLLERDGSVASIRGTNRWAATQIKHMNMYGPNQKDGKEAVHVFEGTKEVMTIYCGRGQRLSYDGLLTPCGTNFIVAFKHKEGSYLHLVDLKRRTFVPLFVWKGDPLTCIAVRMETTRTASRSPKVAVKE